MKNARIKTSSKNTTAMSFIVSCMASPPFTVVGSPFLGPSRGARCVRAGSRSRSDASASTGLLRRERRPQLLPFLSTRSVVGSPFQQVSVHFVRFQRFPFNQIHPALRYVVRGPLIVSAVCYPLVNICSRYQVTWLSCGLHNTFDENQSTD
jgi:hypothetical protein